MRTTTDLALPTPPLGGEPAATGSLLIPAGAVGQAAAFVECLLALALLAPRLASPVVAVLGAAALAGGIALSVATGVGRRFTGIAGWVAALCTTAVVSVVISLLDARGVSLPRELSILAGLAVLGMDWRYVSRLRGAVVLSGLFVVPLAGTHSPWAVAGGLLWLAGALVTFWVLERDARAAVPRVTDPSGGRGLDEDPRPVDLLSVLVPALLIGAAAALVLGNPSCSPKTSKGSSSATTANGSPSGRGGQTGANSSSGNGGGASVDPSAGADPSASSLGAGSAPLYRLDQAGHEQSLDVDHLGGGIIRAGTGPGYSVESRDGRTVVRDADGTVVAEIDGGTVTAHGADGSASQEFQLDGAGHLTVEGTDGQRYQLDESGDALVLRGPNGDVVASGPLDADRVDVRGPDGRALVAGADGAGTIAVPNQATRENLLGQGKTYTTDGSGHPVVVEPDGVTHTYGTDSQGRPQVQVTGPGPARTYVYDESGDTLRVVEFDAQGRFVRDFVVGAPGQPELRATAKPAPGSAGGVRAPKQAADGPNWVLIAAALAVALLAGAVAWWLASRDAPVPRSWGETMADRLGHEGSRRGRRRRPDETVMGYSEALASGPLGDPRVARVGRVVSDALFGRVEPPAATRAWAEATVDEVVAAHPAPRGSDRFRRRSRPSGVPA